MKKHKPTMAQQVAQAAIDFQLQRTGYAPSSAKTLLSQDTLVITLDGALTPAEKAMAASPAGAERLQEYHRKLFASSAESMLQEIKRITGVEVREASAEVDARTGVVMHTFVSGRMVLVFVLSQNLSQEIWHSTTQQS